MKVTITQISRNTQKTGLSDIFSYLYQTKTKDPIICEFETSTGVNSIQLKWIQSHNKKWYSLTIPKEYTKTRKEDIEEFFSTQDQAIGVTSALLFQMWFKDQSIQILEDQRDIITWQDLFDIDTDQQLNDFDNIFNDTPTTNVSKLSLLEVLNTVFNDKNSKVFWDRDTQYSTITKQKEYTLPQGVYNVEPYKTISNNGDIIESPRNPLTKFQISTSSFNINVTEPIDIVLHTEQWIKSSKMYKTRTIVSNWEIRINKLNVMLSKDTYNKIKDSIELVDIVNINDSIKASLILSKKQWELVSEGLMKNVKKVSQKELIDLVYDIEELEVRQSVYNKVLKTINAKINSSTTVSQFNGNIVEENTYWIKDGVYNPPSQDKDVQGWGKTVIKNSIDISFIKFPKTEIEKKLIESTQVYISDLDSINTQELNSRKQKIENIIDWIKQDLQQLRFKLATISYTYFNESGFSDNTDLIYDQDPETKSIDVNMPVKAKDVVGGVKKARFLSDPETNRQIRIQLYQTSEVV